MRVALRQSPTGSPIVTAMAVADWLMDQALLGEEGIAGLFEGCCRQLAAGGIPIVRGYIGFRTLHPLFDSETVTWSAETGAEHESHQWSAGGVPQGLLNSPQWQLLERKGRRLRRRLTGRGHRLDFPVLAELKARGMTDYLAFVEPYDRERGDGIIGSWATSAPGGFDALALAALERVQKRLAVAVKMRVKEATARTLLDTYLGPEAGRRVLAGSIKRGDSETMEGAIWYCDLRDSTALSQSLPADRYLALLDDYFTWTAGSVMDKGGQVLLLIGDAVLAIFPSGGPGGEQAACAAALSAAAEAQRRAAAAEMGREEVGEPRLRFGIGLHLGSFAYGNIGVPSRLQFTAVGPAVNEAARLEDLTKRLGEPVLASSRFAAALPRVSWQTLGRHRLRGVERPHEVLAPVSP